MEMRKGKSIIAFLLVFVLLSVTTVSLSGCAVHHYEGAGVGAVIGGIAGALLDRENPWRGGVIGGALGAVAGATLTDISVRGSREAAASGRPVEYRTEDGRGFYRAEPVSDWHRPDAHTRCRKVRERVWENGRLVKDTVREICESEKFERRY
jgi:hypothetical protein